MTEKFTCENLALKGKIKSIKESTYKYTSTRKGRSPLKLISGSKMMLFNMLGVQTSELKLEQDSMVSIKYFTKKGRIKEEIILSNEGLVGSRITHKYKSGLLRKKTTTNGFGIKIKKHLYEYGENHLLKTHKCFHGENIKFVINYKYDNDDRLAEEHETDSKGRISHTIQNKYNGNGHLVETKEFIGSGEAYATWKFEYSEMGEKIREIKHEYFTSELFVWEYFYNANSLLIKRICSDKNMNLLHSFENIYGEQDGQLLKKVVYHKPKNSEEISEYGYDSLLNRIGEKHYINKKLNLMIEREIDYYDVIQ